MRLVKPLLEEVVGDDRNCAVLFHSGYYCLIRLMNMERSLLENGEIHPSIVFEFKIRIKVVVGMTPKQPIYTDSDVFVPLSVYVLI